MQLGLDGRVALVTGAAGGIGSAAARALVDEGAHVALMDRDAAGLAALAETLRQRGAVVTVHTADVGDPGQVAAAVDAVVAAHGGLDILIACAGISGPVGTALAETTPEQWDQVFGVNVRGTFLVLRAAIPALRRAAEASVVLVSSDSALVATPGMVPYAASKAAVLQLARAAAVELAADGIRVNAVCPSIVDTAMSRTDLEIAPGGFAEVAYPVQSPSDVAAQLLFLVSPRSRPINGTSVLSDFGVAARSGFPA